MSKKLTIKDFKLTTIWNRHFYTKEIGKYNIEISHAPDSNPVHSKEWCVKIYSQPFTLKSGIKVNRRFWKHEGLASLDLALAELNKYKDKYIREGNTSR